MNKRIKITRLAAATTAAVIAVAGCAKTNNTYERNKPTYHR